MTLDLYHKVLVKLYEVTGGKDSQIIDLKDLVKGQGFLGSYSDIFQFLSIQGWITETSKADYVKITHWGLKEAKKTLGGHSIDSGNFSEINENLKKIIKQLLLSSEVFAEDSTEENFKEIEYKLQEINFQVNKLKSNF